MDGIKVTLDYIKRDVAQINEKLDRDYVRHDEFTPVRNIVYQVCRLAQVSDEVNGQWKQAIKVLQDAIKEDAKPKK